MNTIKTMFWPSANLKGYRLLMPYLLLTKRYHSLHETNKQL